MSNGHRAEANSSLRETSALPAIASNLIASFGGTMHIGRFTEFASAVLAMGITLPSTPAAAQTTHAEAKAQVEARDARKHNKLKTEGVPTATGAVAGGVAGGPAGAFAGAKMGHAAGTVIHGVKKHHDIKEVEKQGTPRRRVVRRPRTVRTRTTVRRRTLR
jgi:uncharacterized protein YcfJ